MTAPASKTFNVLFVSDDGTTRAPIAASILNSLPAGRFRAYSAGLKSAEAIPEATMEALKVAGIAAGNVKPTPLDEFRQPGMPRLDFVFTLTEPGEGDARISLPGTPVIVPWPIPRPVLDSGTHAERGSRMADTLRMIRRRVELFAELPLEKLDALAMRLQAESVHRQAESGQAAAG